MLMCEGTRLACLFRRCAYSPDLPLSDLTTRSWDSLPSTLSLNAAISASVVLASRLSSDLQVFALVLFAVQWFALFPIARRRLRVRNETLVFTRSSAALAHPLLLELS